MKWNIFKMRCEVFWYRWDFVLKMAMIASAIVVILLSIGLCNKRMKGEENQQIDITRQIEKLAEHDSFVVSDRTYPVIFKSIKKQLKNANNLISGDEKIRFGLNEYNWLGHGISGGTYLKEFFMDTDDHLIHYKVEFKKDFVRVANIGYPIEFMKVTRY